MYSYAYGVPYDSICLKLENQIFQFQTNIIFVAQLSMHSRAEITFL